MSVRCPAETAELETRLVRAERISVILGSGHRFAHRSVLHPDDPCDGGLAIWPQDAARLRFDLVADAFVGNVERGLVYEFENFSRQGFVGGTVARMEIAAGRAFAVQPAPRRGRSPTAGVARALVGHPRRRRSVDALLRIRPR